MSDGLRADLDSLTTAAAVQDSEGGGVREVASTVGTATASGNTFGLLGRLTGLEDSYRTWQTSQVDQLGQVADLTGRLADGLRRTAQTYRDADAEAERRARALDARLGGEGGA